MADADYRAENNNTAWLATGGPATRLILLRHGVTAYSIQKRFAGRSDLPLLPLGQAQAELGARRVIELGPPAAIIASPLTRTRQTAAALAEATGLAVQLDEGLIETDYGEWDGFLLEEVRQKFPDVVAGWLTDAGLVPPGGESLARTAARVLAARDRIVASYTGRTVAVVTHVSPIKALVTDAVGAPVLAAHRMYLAPASVTVIEYFGDDTTSLRSYNDTAHLDGLA